MLGKAPFVGFVPVRDLAVAREFYEGKLGLEVAEESPVAVVLSAGGALLRATLVPQLTVQPFTIAGWQVADIEATVRELTANGVELAFYEGMGQDEVGVWVAPGGDRIAWFKDPDGNTLSVTAAAPQPPEAGPA